MSDFVVASYVNSGMAKEGLTRANEFLERFEKLGARIPGELIFAL